LPAGTYYSSRSLEQAELYISESGDVIRCESPFDLRVLPERAGPAARRIDQHPVEKGSFNKWQLHRGIGSSRIDAGNAQPRTRFHQGFEPSRVQVAGQYPSPISSQRS
jgi:hypothetical protein